MAPVPAPLVSGARPRQEAWEAAVLPVSEEVAAVFEVVGPPLQASVRYSGSLFLQPRFFSFLF